MKIKCKHRRWAKRNPLDALLAQRRYYRRNAERIREAQRLRDTPEKRAKRNEQFAARNPTYWRDYQRKRRLKLAWEKFTRICASNRITEGCL